MKARIIFVIILFFVFLSANVYAGTAIKTIEVMIDQRGNGSNNQSDSVYWDTRNVRLALPESSIVVQSAWLEIEAYTNNTADYRNLVVQFPKDTNVLVYSPVFWKSSNEQGLFAFKADVNSFFSGKTFPLDVNGAIAISGNPTWNHKMKLFLTYRYDDTSGVEMKTIKYPLDTNTLGALAITKRMYSFDFNAKIADFNGVIQAYAQLYGAQEANSSTTDGNVTPRIGNNAFSTNQFYIRGQGGSAFDIDYLFDINDTFSANTRTQIDVNVENSASTTEDVYVMGGEIIVDYNSDNASPKRTKTVSFFMGQHRFQDENHFVNFNKIINLPETGIAIRAMYLKIYTGWGHSTTSTLRVDVNVGSTSAGQRVYTLDTDQPWTGEHIIINDLNEAMSGLVEQTDTNISVNTKFPTLVNSNEPIGLELIITYDFDDNSSTLLKTVGYFGGALSDGDSRSRDYNYTAKIVVPETSPTRKSAWLVVDHFNGSNDGTIDDYNITTIINNNQSILNVGQHSDNENRTGHVLNGDADSNITASDANYTITYRYSNNDGSVDDNATMSGKIWLTYTHSASVPNDYSFALSLPSSGCTQGKGSFDAGGTCDRGYFEPTDLDGNSDQAKVDAEGQTSSIPFFVYDNQSTTSSDLNIYLDLNDGLPPTFVLKASKVYGGWSYSCSGNTDTNCVQIDVNGTGIRHVPLLEDVHVFCPGGCVGGVHGRIFMKFDIRSISPAVTVTGASMQFNVLGDSTNDNCAFWHLDQNQTWTENDSAENIYAMHTGVFLNSGATLCYFATGDRNFSITSIFPPAVSQRDQNFSFRFDDPDFNSNTVSDLNNSDSLLIGNLDAGKTFASSESSNPPKLFIIYSGSSQNIGRVNYSTGTQDLNIFVWGDFYNAPPSSADRNALSTSRSP